MISVFMTQGSDRGLPALIRAAGLLMLLSLASGGQAIAAKPAIDTTGDERLALRGYDTVAYFKYRQPRRGKARFHVDYLGARWVFSSAANRDAFSNDPERYRPQFGGYCAFSVAQGSALKGSPKHWVITDGKLYLNRTAPIHQRWLERASLLTQRAQKNWPAVLDGQVDAGVFSE